MTWFKRRPPVVHEEEPRRSSRFLEQALFATASAFIEFDIPDPIDAQEYGVTVGKKATERIGFHATRMAVQLESEEPKLRERAKLAEAQGDLVKAATLIAQADSILADGSIENRTARLQRETVAEAMKLRERVIGTLFAGEAIDPLQELAKWESICSFDDGSQTDDGGYRINMGRMATALRNAVLAPEAFWTTSGYDAQRSELEEGLFSIGALGNHIPAVSVTMFAPERSEPGGPRPYFSLRVITEKPGQ